MRSSRCISAVGALLLALPFTLFLPACAPAADTAPAAVAAQRRVDIYTTRSCPYCKALRAYLKARGIDFVDHDVNATQEARAAFYATGAYGVPVVVIGGETIHGFNPVRIEAALNAASTQSIPPAADSASPAAH